MGLAGGTAPGKRADETDLNEPVESAPKANRPVVEKAPVKAPPKDIDFDNDDESLSYFAKLAED
jgi:hypothetical protein